MTTPSSGLQRQFTRVSVETCDGTYTARIEEINVPVGQLVDELLVPVLLAAGYGAGAIAEYVNSEMV